MFDKDQEVQSGGADVDPSVADPAVVASNFGVVVSSGLHSGTEQRPVVGRDGHQPPAFSSRVPSIGHMDLIRRRYENRGLPEGVVQIFNLPAIAMPHQILTKVPGTFGSIGALKEVQIPCLLL
jgi:hypothetical protein